MKTIKNIIYDSQTALMEIINIIFQHQRNIF